MLAALLLAATAVPARAEHVELSFISDGPWAGGADAADFQLLPNGCGSAEGSHVVFFTDEPLVDEAPSGSPCAALAHLSRARTVSGR